MKIKKIISLSLAVIMAMTVLTGCGEAKNSTKSNETKKEKKVLKVGMEVSYPPFEYYEEDGTTITGIDHDLAIAIGDKLGYDVEFVATGWDGIFAGLDKGDYDVIMSAVTITPDRVTNYDFSEPYITNYLCLVTLTNGTNQPKSIEELKGLQVGYQEETTADIYLTDYIESKGLKCSPKEYSKMVDAFSDLKNKRLDAILVDSSVAEQYCADPATYTMSWKQDDQPEKFGICFKKDSDLIDDFNKALKELEDEGKLKEILSNYFAEDNE